MSIEFVVIDPYGKEVDHIDPVVSAVEHEKIWVVDNGYYTYRVPKHSDHQYIQRVRDSLL